MIHSKVFIDLFKNCIGLPTFVHEANEYMRIENNTGTKLEIRWDNFSRIFHFVLKTISSEKMSMAITGDSIRYVTPDRLKMEFRELCDACEIEIKIKSQTLKQLIEQ